MQYKRSCVLLLATRVERHIQSGRANEIAILMSPTSALLVAVLLSACGVLLGGGLGTFAREHSAVGIIGDGFARGAVPCLVVLRVIPELVHRIGPIAVLLALCGYLLLYGADHHDHVGAGGLAISLVVAALLGHSLLDGVALSCALPVAPLAPADLLLAGAIVGHRAAEGLIASHALTPRWGKFGSMMVIAGLALATGAGALVARGLGSRLPQSATSVAVALGMGALVRVVIHRPLARAGRLAVAVRLLGAAAGCCVALGADL